MNRSRRLFRTALTLPLVLGGAGAIAAAPFMTPDRLGGAHLPNHHNGVHQHPGGQRHQGLQRRQRAGRQRRAQSSIGDHRNHGRDPVFLRFGQQRGASKIVTPNMNKTDIITTDAGNGTAGY